MKLDVFEVVEPKFPATFRQSKDVYDTMRTFAKSDREMFFILVLNTRNRMLDYVVHTVGTIDSSAVHARDVIRSAVIHNASSVIICHNHPSSDPEPSACDKEITKALIAAFEIVGIRILDHVVLGNGRFFSFADARLMEDYKVEAGDVLRRLNL
jgi:DNA repair protein RadC